MALYQRGSLQIPLEAQEESVFAILDKETERI